MRYNTNMWKKGKQILKSILNERVRLKERKQCPEKSKTFPSKIKKVIEIKLDEPLPERVTKTIHIKGDPRGEESHKLRKQQRRGSDKQLPIE